MSRGKIVNEAALVDALEEGHLAGAGLDVTATEPLPVGDPLWTAPNLIVTPHTSASSPQTTELVWSILSENLGRFLRGETLINLVDKQPRLVTTAPGDRCWQSPDRSNAVDAGPYA